MPVQLSVIYNIGSIILGIVAWASAGIAIAKSKRTQTLSAVSFVACIISLFLQLLEVSNRVNLGDYAAIEDTIRAVILAATLLIVVTIILNVVALLKYKSK